MVGLEKDGHPFSKHLSKKMLLQGFQAEEGLSSQKTLEGRLLALVRETQSDLRGSRLSVSLGSKQMSTFKASKSHSLSIS